MSSIAPEVEILARQAGLGRALLLFPDDVAEAVRAAVASRQALGGDLPPRIEPYTPPSAAA